MRFPNWRVVVRVGTAVAADEGAPTESDAHDWVGADGVVVDRSDALAFDGVKIFFNEGRAHIFVDDGFEERIIRSLQDATLTLGWEGEIVIVGIEVGTGVEAIWHGTFEWPTREDLDKADEACRILGILDDPDDE